MIIETLKEMTFRIDEVIHSNLITFDEVSSLKSIMGVYLVYDENDLLYIGKTNNFHVRFGTDLKHESTHTLVSKLIRLGRFSNRYEVVEYLKYTCKYKVAFCKSDREALAIEALLIYLLNPTINQ